MIYIYTPQERFTNPIKQLVAQHSAHTIQMFTDMEAIYKIAKIDRPKAVFLFSPRDNGEAVDLQRFLRAILPHCCVRILPSDWKTGELLYPYWIKVILKALKVPFGKHFIKKGEK